MAIYGGFTHEKWWFSMAMLVYQRVTMYGSYPWTIHIPAGRPHVSKSSLAHQITWSLLEKFNWLVPSANDKQFAIENTPFIIDLPIQNVDFQ